ncbi:MAG: hypothetical protein VYD90_10235 [Pseudomonadota bacterium]|nr:hypothetical protein [Pseudomonadota bacterium]
MSAIEIYTDAVRWWGFIAGVIGLSDFHRRVTAWRCEQPWMPVRLIWMDAAAKALVCLFLVSAGLVIPFTSRINGFTLESQSFLAVMAAAWTCISGAGWSYVISRAYRSQILILCAALALGSCLFAAIITAGG